MEANKENISSKSTKNAFKTRIPVPVEPLPLLPKHLIIKTTTVRVPLKAIESFNANIPSSSHQVQKNQEETKIREKVTLPSHVRHVIASSKNKTCWSHNIFNDDGEMGNAAEFIKREPKDDEACTGPSCSMKSKLKEMLLANREKYSSRGEPNSSHDIAFIISDDDNEKHETVLFTEDERKLQISKIDHTLVTPATVIEHRGVRNIKKSLKRPHSRELQGLSPSVKEESVEDKAKRRLMFDRLEDRLLSSDVWTESYTKCLTREYTDDIFPHLQSVERKPLGVPQIASKTRACIINWLIKINGPHGNPAVIQSACWYMDSYLRLRIVQVSKLQMVAAACYWIAQKLHGPMFSASKMVLLGDNAFTAENLRAAEMRVLSELKFPQQPVVPQEFITYLSWWCDHSHHGEIEVAATFLCMAGLMVDKSLANEYPSVIAGAAVKTALLLLGKNRLVDRLRACPVYQICVKKFNNLCMASFFLRAICTISSPKYEYKVLIEHFRLPPYHIAQTVVETAHWLTFPDL